MGYTVFANDIFIHVTNMGLDWCKLLVATSGWVSDNYVAFARISKWFYYPIILLHQHEVYSEPRIPLEKWFVKMCRDWLAAFGYNSSGNLSVLRERIKSIKNDPQVTPKLTDQGSGSAEEVCNLIGAMLSMISSTVKKEVTAQSIDYVDR